MKLNTSIVQPNYLESDNQISALVATVRLVDYCPATVMVENTLASKLVGVKKQPPKWTKSSITIIMLAKSCTCKLL